MYTSLCLQSMASNCLTNEAFKTFEQCLSFIWVVSHCLENVGCLNCRRMLHTRWNYSKGVRRNLDLDRGSSALRWLPISKPSSVTVGAMTGPEAAETHPPEDQF